MGALSDAFLRNNAEDPAWIASLPTLIARLAERWSLTVASPFPNLSWNYVAPATRADGTSCVLKVSRHVGETRNEIAALQLWAGDGASRLLACEPDQGALLIERLEPGTMLTTVAEEDDDAATTIAAGVLARLWCPAPANHGLRSLESWCAAYDRNRDVLSRGVPGFPAALFLRADVLRAELLATTTEQTVLHGDLHHYNVLTARRAPWLAIDPKGLVGDRHFDVCQFFRNPDAVPIATNTRRLDRFCATLGLDRERVRAWCLVHAVLDACWEFEEQRWVAAAVAYAEATQRY